jgi:anhydro-N-acetylmuramic acid kinase
LLLNLGGIANLTVLPAGCRTDDVIAFDTGPANMVIDTIANTLLGTQYDANGQAAARGSVHDATLRWALEDAYFAEPPPKSTGRERYGQSYTQELLDRLRQQQIRDPETALATATEITVESIARAYERFVMPRVRVDRVVAAGGGTQNDHMMSRLRARLGIPVDVTDDHGVPADAKEAVCFAVLAHEYVNGVPTSLPSVTGAGRSTMLGKLCLPAPE